MITLADATARVLAAAEPLDALDLPLAQAGGSVLRDDLVADLDAPPFDASAMDGYAVRAADLVDLPVRLEVVATSSCGHPSSTEVRPGTAVRILTGAVVPPGADCVVPVERTNAGTDHVLVQHGSSPGDCIRRRGEVIRAGETLVPSGTVLTAGHLGLAASEGRSALRVTRTPRVAVVSTGDELVPPGEGRLGPGQIFDSNSTVMAELASRAGCEVARHSVGDDAARLAQLLEQLSTTSDVILTSGGVSMGAEFDPLRAALAAHPVEFWRVAIKPAKPFAFGTVGDAVYAGLPGNPVAVVVSFELFVRPLLERLRGLESTGARRLRGEAAHPVERARDDRTHLVPMRRTSSGRWATTELVGSHALTGVTRADALAVLTPEHDSIAAGGPLELVPLWT